MLKRFALAAAPVLFLLTAATPPPPDPLPADEAEVEQTVRVAMETGLGTIVLELDEGRAPVTTANFLKYVDEKRFDGTEFYRVMRMPWGERAGLIQGGTQNAPKRVLPPIAHEPTSQTGLSHTTGTISMARYDPGTATGDFTIMTSNMTGLDADEASNNLGFAAFGQVVEGMEVVNAIYDVPLSQTKGVGVMKGQMIEDPVEIVSVRRIEAE